MGDQKSETSSLIIGFIKTLIFAVLVFAITGAAFFQWFERSYSDELRLTLNHKPPVITILADNGHILARRGVRHPDISINRLPQSLINAVVSTEDRRFFSHWGLDPLGLMRAVWNNIYKGRLREGGSTITQQLVKNVFLTHKRTLTRKFRELVISLWLEQHYSKRQILEYYFNRVYFGTGASHGINAAARTYFNKPAADLDLAESALLAGLLKAPSYYSPRKNLKRSRQRASVVLDNMLATGVITPQQAKYARQHPASLHQPSRQNKQITGTEYALDWIFDQLQQLIGSVETDLTVKTTVNYDWQIKAQKLIRQTIEANKASKNIDQAAAILMDQKGGIKLMIGGTSYQKSQFNRVTQAHRQPGSSFKPIIYLAAMEKGRTPDSILQDERVKIKGWRPRNYARFHRGPVTLRKALASSINSVAAKLADEVGLERVISTARRLGIHSPLAKRPALALGSSEVTPLEMTGAYVAFMNGGFEASPHIIREVVSNTGEVIYKAADKPARRIISKSYIYDMNDMLGAVIDSGTGRRARLDRHMAAGKTGTTQDYRDAWFIGYTAYYTCGIWSGNDDNSPTNKISGGRLPALLWKQIMQLVHKDKKPRPIPGLRSQNMATAQTPSIILEQQPLLEDIMIAEKSGDEQGHSPDIIIYSADSDSDQ